MMLLAIAMQWVIVGLGTVVAIGLIYAGLTSGHRILLAIGGAVVCGLIVLVVIERLVVTDEERVIEMLRQAAAAAEANDIAGVNSFVHPDAEELRREVAARLPRYRFDSVGIGVRRVEIQSDAHPKRGRITFIAAPSGQVVDGSMPIPNTARVFIELQVELVQDRWLIRSYRLGSVQEAFKKQG